MIHLLIGGVRAGKSGRAVQLAESTPGNDPILFVATAQAFDDEMRVRIDAHRRERSGRWHTLESPVDLVRDLANRLSEHPNYGAIVIDCVTLWTSNILLSLDETADAEREIGARVESLMSLLAVDSLVSADIFIVTNEVGLGVVPPTPLGRRYRDALGRANQLIAAAAGRVTLFVAGIEVPVKPRG